jgi:phospholipid/cholesterol/gamma-HCH transport system ATP-binding protein
VTIVTISDDHAIELRGVGKRFDEKLVYEGLALAVRRGETFAVIGPSGCGKSVLLKLIIGLLKPEEGAVLVDGVDVAPLGELALRGVRRKVGMLFQGSALFDSMSVGDNVAYGLYEHYDWSAAKVRERVAECLEWVGLPGIEWMHPAELSGGMKKRVGLARALAPGPDIILYDEPTTGLDPENRRRINELIASLRARLRVTSMVITHDIESVFAVSDRLGLVAHHRVDLVLSVEEAQRAPPPPLEAFVQGEALDGDALR